MDDSFIVPNLLGRFLVGDGSGVDDNGFARDFDEEGLVVNITYTDRERDL